MSFTAKYCTRKCFLKTLEREMDVAVPENGSTHFLVSDIAPALQLGKRSQRETYTDTFFVLFRVVNVLIC